MRLIWAPEAVHELNQIYDFYAAKNLRAAAVIYNSILNDAERLKTNPYSAQIDPLLDDLPQKYRSLVVSKGRFKVTYFIAHEIICIVYVWSCRQNPQRVRRRFICQSVP